VPRESRQHIAELRQLDLQLAFAAPRLPGENVENELRAVDHAAFRDALDVALLHGRKIAVEDDQRRLARSRFRADLVQLAPADQRGRVRCFAELEDRARDLRPGALRQLNELGEGFALRLPRGHAGETRPPLPAHADKQRALGTLDFVRCFHRERNCAFIASLWLLEVGCLP
jgi:hypothetical protein